MRDGLRDESGFTLVEVLLTCVLMLIVLGATLTTFNSFESNSKLNERQNDAQEKARLAIDHLARELRNLASPVDWDPAAVKRADADDLIVQSVAEVRPDGSLNARNTQYVRYCYDEGEEQLYRQTLTWTTEDAPAVPTAEECPGSGWANSAVVASDLVNDVRSIFTYNGTSLTTITEIHSNLYIDVNDNRRPREASIETTVFLRNQNRVPTASFTAAATANGAILLNGSESTDPEERALSYFWFDEAVSGSSVEEEDAVGTGIVFSYTPPAYGSRSLFLVVKDPADLSATAPSQTVCVPGGGVTC